MPYCTLADIDAPEQDLIDLTDDSASGIIDQTVVDKAIAYAGEMIDGYLRGKYALPLDPVPPLLTQLAASISLRKIYGHRPRTVVPDSLADEYKAVIRTLEKISKGEIVLGTTGLTPDPITTSAKAQVVAPDRVFSRKSLKGY